MSEVETEPQTEPEPDGDENGDENGDATEPEGRCEAEVTVGGNLYRCALQTLHDDEHSYARVDTGEVLEPSEVEQAATEDMQQVHALARAVKNYGKAVVGVLGADLGDFAICPCCSPRTPGLFIQHDHTPEEIAAMKTILGMPTLENYEYDRRYLKCSTCNGKGHVRTPSDVPAEMVKGCRDCKGRGWMPGDDNVAAELLIAPAVEPPNGGESLNGEPPPFDPWGRPFGDPDYYRMPIAGVTT